MNDYWDDDEFWDDDNDYSVPYTTDKSAYLNNHQPSYTDERFKDAQTIFLAEGYKLQESMGTPTVKGAYYQYSDRLWQYRHEASQDAWNQAIESLGATMTASLIEAYLRLYFQDEKLNLVHIMAGWNNATLSPYRIYGYFEGKS